MAVTLDPSAAALAAMMRESGRRPLETLSPAEAREQFAATQAAVRPDPPVMRSVEDMLIPGPDGAIRIRVYTPLALPATNAAPGFVFYHGGGWVVGDLESYDVVCSEIATRASMIVVSVAYRLAPEHRFPASLDDCIAATVWIAGHATRLGIDATRLFVGGDSAGGNLAAVVTMHARHSKKPRLAGQVLVYPVTDLAMDSASHSDPDTDVLLTHAAMRWFRSHYLGDLSQIADWQTSPLRMPHLQGLPPALVATCGADPLHDEGEEFARRLRDAGNDVLHIDYPGQFHGFLNLGKLLPEANRLIAEIADWLKRRAAEPARPWPTDSLRAVS
jgi:acetyl esterase